MIDSGYVPIVADGDEFLGLVTAIDIVNHPGRVSASSTCS